jgi:endonuclease-3
MGVPITNRLHNTTHKRGVVELLRAMNETAGTSRTLVSKSPRQTEDPFWVLIATMLSHRTKEKVALAACRRLFRIAPTPDKLARTAVREIEKRIYPVGFYKKKARAVRDAAAQLVAECGGVVPDSIDGLLRFRGVGRKTANMVVIMGYGKDGICVDTHVHRVSNRLGLVTTDTPEKTEDALMEIVPERYRRGCNELFVRFGREICRPVNPLCARCPFEDQCPRIGLDRHRETLPGRLHR